MHDLPHPRAEDQTEPSFGCIILLHHQRYHVQFLLMAVVCLLSCEHGEKYVSEHDGSLHIGRTGLGTENSALCSLGSPAVAQLCRWAAPSCAARPTRTIRHYHDSSIEAVSQPLAHYTYTGTMRTACMRRSDSRSQTPCILGSHHIASHRLLRSRRSWRPLCCLKMSPAQNYVVMLTPGHSELE